MKDTISIIVPIYKVEKELPRCVDSIRSQTYADLEIILVDDGSPDHCPQMCDEYAKEDPRIRVIHKVNGGLSDARNAGLKVATGKYIMYVDSDDSLEPTACEKLITGMLDETVDFVVGAANYVVNNISSIDLRKGVVPHRKYNAREFIIRSIQEREWYAGMCRNLYRREFLLANELYFCFGRYYEDMEMLPRLYLSANNVVYVDTAFYNYIIREGSITTGPKNPKKTADAFENYVEWKRQFDALQDQELQQYLYGFLIKCYLRSCIDHGVTSWQELKFSLPFMMKYALDTKERIKVLLFYLFPKIYIGLR